ncbi:MAG: septum formation protein Maf [Anaerolineales bacterium]|nr:septum formation protein Maf [Anaerolineales bacterium]
MNLVLASESPRRRELLRQSGIGCIALPVSIDEEIRPGEDPQEAAVRLACKKARAASLVLSGLEEWILAADTVVADGKTVLGKPCDRRQAEEYLLRLRGRAHRVITGVCLLRLPSGEEASAAAVTAVRMRNYSDPEIAEYLSGGNALDKAGGYAIQDSSFRPVESINGCYTNVVGLPLCLVYGLLEEAGNPPARPLPEACRTGNGCGFAPVRNERPRRVTV